MEYICIIIEKHRLVFSYKSRYVHNENIIDTLIYDKQYLKSNITETQELIKKIIKEKKIDISEALINQFDILSISLNILNDIDKVRKLIIKDNRILNFDICKKLLENKYIKEIECYDLAENMLNELEKNDVNVYLRTEILNISNFVFSNKLNLYDDIYYRERVFFDRDIDNKDVTGFVKFCEINEYLKQVDIYGKFTISQLKEIIQALIDNNLNNVDINIYPEVIGIDKVNEIVGELKKLNKKTKKSKGIKITSRYTNLYKKKNYLKQVNFYNFKTAIGMIIAIVVIELSYMGFYIYRTYRDIDKVKDMNPNKNVVVVEENKVVDTGEQEVVETEEDIENNNTQTSEPLVQDFSKLTEINPDTVGWLTVNNTKVDYPIVKSVNNDYYLNKNFYKRTTAAGWLFMDYRNNIDTLSKNTIIYGHSAVKNSLMFTTLKTAIEESWYTKPENQIITFNTLNANMKWQIFSIYATEPSFNYIDTNFLNDRSFNDFIAKIKGRSVHNFGVNVDASDNILTLTTCYENGNKRLVIHAKLIK